MSNPKPAIRINQVWKQKGSTFAILIAGKAKVSNKWKTKVLSEKPNVFKGSHTMSQWTLYAKFELVQ
jgi:hypothetical protein